MAVDSVVDGQGTVFSIDGVPVNGVRQIRGLGSGARPTRDRTTFADVSHRRFGMGLAPASTPTVDVLTNPTDQGQRLCSQAANSSTVAEHSFSCALVDGTTLTWIGYVSSFPLDINTDADVTTSMGLIVDGVVAGFPAPA